ncbi:3352_t:CDS:2, partial [Funneliformis geosporum]
MDIEQTKEEFKQAKEELKKAKEKLEKFNDKKQERLDELLLKMANEEERNDQQKKYWGIMIDNLNKEKNFLMGQVEYYQNKLSEFNNNAVKRKSETVSSEEDVDRRASDRIKKVKKTASAFALSQNWVEELDNDNPAFLNGRPPKNYDIPITLYHNVFGEFLKDCKDFNITNEDKNLVCDLLITMSGTFKSHNERVDAFREWAKRFVNYDTTSYKFNRNDQEIDGVWRKEYNGETILFTIFEFKNEFSQGDPYMQACAYFAKFFEELHDKNSHILHQTCIPTFIVYIYGPYFGIA